MFHQPGCGRGKNGLIQMKPANAQGVVPGQRAVSRCAREAGTSGYVSGLLRAVADHGVPPEVFVFLLTQLIAEVCRAPG